MSGRYKRSGSNCCARTQRRLPQRRRVLVIDETGDRKDGHKTAHVARKYLGKLGKIDNRVASTTRLWAGERVYYPLDIHPYPPETDVATAKDNPDSPPTP